MLIFGFTIFFQRMAKMIPVDLYDIMIDEISHRETNLVPTTAGVLLVDYNFRNAREILQPALKSLNQLSGDIINFYLPGYESVSDGTRRKLKYRFENNDYKFCERTYQEFCSKFFQNFNIDQTISPSLILFEYGNESLYNSSKIIIDLSEELTDIKNIELLFKEIVQQAKKSPDLLGHSNALQFKGLMKRMPDILDDMIRQKYIKAAFSAIKEIRRYKIQ